VEQNQSGIGTGTLLLSFITGLAAGIAAALLIDSSKDEPFAGEEQEDQLFI
jgi:tetrahydromethanopterin S-methyltransferase subunit D